MPAANGKPTKYRKKPVVIETMRFDASSYRARKPTSAWGRSLNAVLGAANNLLKPCGCAEQSAPTDLASELDRDYIAHHTEPCKQCHGTKVTYGV